MPPFSLTNQNGEPISLDTFRGQSFVLTFVFKRCPVPNFCPRMSNNFEELQSAIKTSSDSLAKTQLLSVTLDPAYDTPKVFERLRRVSPCRSQNLDLRNRRRKKHRFASRAFSVYRQTEGGAISLGLATALIDRNGTVERIWRGNAWTPAEVTQALKTESK